MEKILHISPGPFCDGWTYQDNILTKYHKKMGFSVTMLTSNWIFNDKGEYEKVSEESYFNEDGVKVIRMRINGNKHQNYPLKKFYNFYEYIVSEKPDIIFLHNLNYLDAKKVSNYCKKHKNVRLFVDNHCDESNSGRNFISKYFFHKFLWKTNAKALYKYASMFFGVLPARVEFLQKYYGVKKEKTDLLIMGADDEFVNKYKNTYDKRNQYFDGKINSDTTIIITGGKIDKFKIQTLSLMKYVLESKKKICLLVFGSVDKEIQNDFFALVDNNKVIYLGWLNFEQTYEYISLADICVFPGRHSVLWEQAVAQQKPLIVKRWSGTMHVNFSNNVIFLENDTFNELCSKLNDALLPDKLIELKNNARKEGFKDFLYSNIAVRSLLME